jgi:hypothetical protein
MGAMIMFGVVLLIAVVGTAYFVIQDKKASHESEPDSSEN